MTPTQTRRLMSQWIRAILEGEWTNEPPVWADFDKVSYGYRETPDYDRAVQTAEAFILLCQADDDAFDVQRFLQACGLADTPTTKGRS